MKFLSKEAIIASRTKMRVQREVDYMRMLRHPHIIKLSVNHDYFTAIALICDFRSVFHADTK